MVWKKHLSKDRKPWMDSENWERYREIHADDGIPFEEIERIFSDEWRDYPEGKHFDAPSVVKFLREIPEDEVKVVEFGGGKGFLTADVFQRDQIEKLTVWDNYDISTVAIADTRCHDPRYRGILLDAYPWLKDIYMQYNTCILSNFVDHKKVAELTQLFEKLKNVKYLYVKALISETDAEVDWVGYSGTHILEVGWVGFEIFLEKTFGFVRTYKNESQDFNARFYARDNSLEEQPSEYYYGFCRGCKYLHLDQTTENRHDTYCTNGLAWSDTHHPDFVVNPDKSRRVIDCNFRREP